MALFERSGLEQDTGRMSQRWGQEGSTPMSFSGSTSGTSDIYTVTAGKKFYVTDVILNNTTNSQTATVKDNADVVATLASGFGGYTTAISFSTPLVIETYLKITTNGGSLTWTITGWEE